jgi:arginase
VTGRGQDDLAAIEGRRPYFRDADVVVLGIRGHDEHRLDLQAAGLVTRPVQELRAEGAARSAQWARDQLAECVGYWVHVDVDVLDPAVMPAVDAPEPGGIAFTELELLLAGLVGAPHCLGVELTVFDPDYDPDGGYAGDLVATLVTGLAALRPSSPVDDGSAAGETTGAGDAGADAAATTARPDEGARGDGSPAESAAAKPPSRPGGSAKPGRAGSGTKSGKLRRERPGPGAVAPAPRVATEQTTPGASPASPAEIA